jgi:hypothetical protein
MTPAIQPIAASGSPVSAPDLLQLLALPIQVPSPRLKPTPPSIDPSAEHDTG